jgi:hypothetical protein
MIDAFLGSRADDLFTFVATPADATELQALDVTDGQMEARQAIKTAMANARRRNPNPGTRIALIKGEAGSGKSHALTMTFKAAAGMPTDRVFPVVLQLTAPVATSDYQRWLLDAIVRQLSARHFADDANQSPLRRLADQLAEHVDTDEREKFLELVDQEAQDETIRLARTMGARIRRRAKALLHEMPPSDAFIAIVLLAGFDDWSALNYLCRGVIDDRIKGIGLSKVDKPEDRIRVIADLGLTAQMVGASLALGFDQVENAARLGDEELFTHALVQAVRIAESVPNCSVSIAALADVYDEIVSASGAGRGLPASDRDRIEDEVPRAICLERGSPTFLEQVVARRLAVLRRRAKLSENVSLEPLPDWLLPRIRDAGNVRSALREVSVFRERAVSLGRIPLQAEYEEVLHPLVPILPNEAVDFDKLWADHLDRAGVTHVRLLPTTKAELVAWWATEASREQVSSDQADVQTSTLNDEFDTPTIDLGLKSGGVLVERRQLALCEAPNRDHKLANQVDRFLKHCLENSHAVPAILRTNGFPKGRTAQVGAALRNLEAVNGLKLDLNDIEWNNLQRARDFATQHAGNPGFMEWRREGRWLIQWMGRLSRLIATPDVLPVDEDEVHPERLGARTEVSLTVDGGGTPTASNSNAPFPVLIGQTDDGNQIIWDPYGEHAGSLNNFGFLVTGDAGSGKTQTIRVLIDAACKHSLSVCIFDFKADYCDPSFVKPLGIEVVDVRMRGLPFNPLQPPPSGPSGVQPAEHAYELAGILARVFGLGQVQAGILRDAINETYQEAGISPREWVDPSGCVWPIFDQVMGKLRDQPRAAALVTKLALFTDLGLFPRTQISSTFADFINRRVSLKLSDLPTDEVKSAIAEIIIIQLHGYALRGEQPRQLKRMMVFDEAHRVRSSRRLEALAREGRAFGVGVVIGTQFPGDIPETMAGNLATQLFLMNNQAQHRRFVVKQVFGTTSGNEPRKLLDNLKQLKQFEGFFSNAHQSALVRVTPHYKRQ